MHELYIAECILKSTRDSLPENQPTSSVVQVRVQVGRLDAIIPETLNLVFNAIKASYEMPWAELWIEQIDVMCQCSGCGHEFEIEQPLFICPRCGSSYVKVLRGRGITLNGITVDDDVGGNNGNTHHS